MYATHITAVACFFRLHIFPAEAYNMKIEHYRRLVTAVAGANVATPFPYRAKKKH